MTHIKKLILVLAFIIVCQKSFSTTFDALDRSRYNSDDVVTLVERVVPNDVRDAFLAFTEDKNTFYQDTIRVYLLAVGKKESEWKYTRSFRANYDGSYDVGYLMLNENNITDPTFVKNFIPTLDDKYTVKTKQEFYLATCIKFYKYLFNRYSCDACYAYNAGERRYIEQRIPDVTYKYKRDIAENVKMYLNELYTIGNDRMEKEREDKLAELTYKMEQLANLNEKVIQLSIRENIVNIIDTKLRCKTQVKHFYNRQYAILPSNKEKIRRATAMNRVITVVGLDNGDMSLLEKLEVLRTKLQRIRA